MKTNKKKTKKKKKKGCHQNWNTFSPNSTGHLRSDTHQSQIIGGDADVDHTQTIGGYTVKLLGGIYPLIPPRVSAPLTTVLFCSNVRHIGVAKIFDWGGPNHKSHAMTSSETSKAEFLWGQRYHRMEDQKPWAGVGT